jgi:hypothetical protein
MSSFLGIVNVKYHLHLETYDDLYQWSIDKIPEFWQEIWHFCGIRATRPFDEVSYGQPIRGHFPYFASACWHVIPLDGVTPFLYLLVMLFGSWATIVRQVPNQSFW